MSVLVVIQVHIMLKTRRCLAVPGYTAVGLFLSWIFTTTPSQSCCTCGGLDRVRMLVTLGRPSARRSCFIHVAPLATSAESHLLITPSPTRAFRTTHTIVQKSKRISSASRRQYEKGFLGGRTGSRPWFLLQRNTTEATHTALCNVVIVAAR